MKLKPLFRLPFTLYFICIETYTTEEYDWIENKKYLCLARKKFKPVAQSPSQLYYFERI